VSEITSHSARCRHTSTHIDIIYVKFLNTVNAIKRDRGVEGPKTMVLVRQIETYFCDDRRPTKPVNVTKFAGFMGNDFSVADLEPPSDSMLQPD